ncbi:MAG: hypothetical protein VB017_05460 [Endomicrobiaceae bacterium]|nr:hypothetical protein [Endomicrobiaceae bacterium]
MTVIKDTVLPKPQTKEDNELIYALNNVFKKIKDVVNGSLSFKDNFDSQSISVEITSVDEPVSLTHKLKREPEGLIMIGSCGGIVYMTNHTTTSLTVKATVVGSYKILIF